VTLGDLVVRPGKVSWVSRSPVPRQIRSNSMNFNGVLRLTRVHKLRIYGARPTVLGGGHSHTSSEVRPFTNSLLTSGGVALTLTNIQRFLLKLPGVHCCPGKPRAPTAWEGRYRQRPEQAGE